MVQSPDISTPDIPGQVDLSDDVEQIVLRDKARALLGSVDIGVLGSTFCAMVVAFAAELRTGKLDVLWILVPYCVFQVIRVLMAIPLKRRSMAETSPWTVIRFAVIGSFLNGALWGLCPVVAALTVDSRLGFVAAVASVGCATGVVALSGAMTTFSLAFAMPAVLGITVFFIIDPSVDGPLLAFCTLALSGFLIMIALRTERAFDKSSRTAADRAVLVRSLRIANQRARAAAQEFERLATHDALTGLPNRAAASDRLNMRLKRAAVARRQVGVVMLDVDHFKQVNDVLGHPTGDRLLVEVASRLRGALAEEDMVARVGGDEFALMFDLGDGRDPASVADRVLAAFEAPFLLQGRQSTIGVSMGIAVYPVDGTSPDDLLAHADIALYASKQHGRSRWALFDRRLGEKAREEREIEADLRVAIRDGAIRYHFQPQISILDRRPIGFEALMRWTHPVHGAVAPDVVVAAAHRSNQAEALLELALDAAADMLHRLAQIGQERVRVAVNVSPLDFLAFDVAGLVETVIRRRQLPPSLIEVEITEDAMLNLDAAGPQLERLERLGVPLAVDDFGVGYSSLARLRDLKIDRLKIDKRFVQGVAENAGDRALFQAITAVGRSLDIELVAEGIETFEQLETVAELGCSVAQGYLFSPALPPSDVIAWLSVVTPKAQAGFRPFKREIAGANTVTN